MRPAGSTTPARDEARSRVRLVVRRAAAPANWYEGEPALAGVALAGVDTSLPPALLECGEIERTADGGGGPLRAVVLVRAPTFPGCRIVGYPIGLLHLGETDGPPAVVVVPAVDQDLVHAHEIADLPDEARRALAGLGQPGGDVAAATAALREATERYLRDEAAAKTMQLLTWKAGDVKPPKTDRGEAEPHTFAEYAVTYLPARFQEYIARALLPDERILQFVQRPQTTLGGTFRRRTLREGLAVVTDRQVLLMQDSTSADTTFVHWGYIARCCAVEQVVAAEVQADERFATLRVTAMGAFGCEAMEFAAPAEALEALLDMAALLEAFNPPAETRTLRRRYPRLLPQELPALAQGLAPGGPPSWAQELLAGEELLAWARAPERPSGPPPTVVVGAGSAVVMGGRKAPTVPMVISVPALTTLEMTLSLMGSGLELTSGSPRGVERYQLRFDYPAAPAFLTAWTALRHLMGNPPQDDEYESAFGRA